MDEVMDVPELRGRVLLQCKNVGGLRRGFLDSVASNPQALSLIIGSRTWSYGELDDIARRWASRLLDCSNGRPQRVGVFAQRSETAYAGVLAALYAGAAFVPLNRKFPIERTRQMIDSANLDAVFVDAGSLRQLPELFEGLARVPAVLLPDAEIGPFAGFGRSALAVSEPLRELPVVADSDLAYLLFTSGSTGRPKGVPITHANVSAFLHTNHCRYRLSESDRVSQTFDQTFDLSVFDLFMPWQAGAAVCVLQPIELLSPFKSLERNGVTVWFSVPSVANHLIRNGLLKPDSMPGLRWSLFCGEALPRAVAEAWQEAAPNSILENLYGPTELTIACSAYRWDRATSPAACVQDLVPIGHVYESLHELVVDPDLEPVADGELGELCVAGAQTFAGYWNAPELDRECFVLHEDGDNGARRYYRTGDLVRKMPQGHFIFAGRRDQQVKVGGYRVELGEVEAGLRQLGCAEVVALAHPDCHGNNSIRAIVSGSIDGVEVIAQLRQRLPGYMVPSVLYGIEAMPLNANGKIDRNALRAMLERGELQSFGP